MAASTGFATTITTPSDREIVITRVFDAPRTRVFEAWTKPEHVARWWGCTASTLYSCEIDLRPGGTWRFVVRMPDGSEYPFKGEYREIVPPERLVYTHVFDVEGIRDRPALVTVSFGEQDGQTKLTETILHQTVEDRDGHLQSGMEEGAAQTLDRLAEYLNSSRPPQGMPQQESTMKVEPQKEHQWLQKLVGDWEYEAEATMKPGEPPVKATGTESVRSLGGLWVLAEGKGEIPGGGPGTTVMTLGYDPQKKRYVGTWIGSMMTHLWVYDGALDAAGNVLALDTEGPDMASEGKMAKYREVIDISSDDHRVFTSHILGADGKWHPIMTANYKRKK